MQGAEPLNVLHSSSSSMLINYVMSEYYRWVLWYLKNDKQKEWKDNLRKIICIDTVSF